MRANANVWLCTEKVQKHTYMHTYIQRGKYEIFPFAKVNIDMFNCSTNCYCDQIALERIASNNSTQKRNKMMKKKKKKNFGLDK